MNKIVIFGSYDGESIGDTAILIGLVMSIARINKDIDITVLTTGQLNLEEELERFDINLKKIKTINIVKKISINKIKNKIKRFFYPEKIWTPEVNTKKIKQVFKEHTYLMIGGGNLIMDYYPSWPILLYEICTLAKTHLLKYSFIGVGASPINTEEGGGLLLKCLSGAEAVFFRDSYSKTYCEEKISFYKSKVGLDLALGINFSGHITRSKDKHICVNVASVYSKQWPEFNEKKFEKYIENMSELISNTAKDRKVKKVILYNTNYPLDDLASKLIIEKFNSNKTIEICYFDKKLTVIELLYLCLNAEICITTRLHAGIIAHLAGSKVIAIAYQEKVKNVLIESDITKNIINIESFKKIETIEIDEKKIRNHVDVDNQLRSLMSAIPDLSKILL